MVSKFLEKVLGRKWGPGNEMVDEGCSSIWVGREGADLEKFCCCHSLGLAELELEVWEFI